MGVQFSNLDHPASLTDKLTFAHIIMMFIIDSIIYLLAALYISNVFPGRYGLPKKWNYFLTKSYWFGKPKPSKNSLPNHLQLETIYENNDYNHKNYYVAGMKLQNLTKTYQKNKIKALSNFNLTMSENEITVLLGHNGAGKTTLMSILCGLIPPTSGSVWINGYHLEDEIDSIRKSLGVCPQFDILFNHLTVEEHLWLFCKLKDVDEQRIPSQIDRMIKLLDFESKRRSQAYTLSGGMKRKLSVGIALIGDSKVVLLDEATSGMDVSARRFIWDLLSQEKENRTILLSTHFMEEADVLGDQIAIVENGQLKCSGSPMELKKKYGLGYLLTFAVREDKVDYEILNNLIKSHVHHSRALTSIGNEMTFSLPETESNKFENLFSVIEGNHEKLGIINFGISVTTLEERSESAIDCQSEIHQINCSFFSFFDLFPPLCGPYAELISIIQHRVCRTFQNGRSETPKKRKNLDDQSRKSSSSDDLDEIDFNYNDKLNQSVIEKIRENSLELNNGLAHTFQTLFGLFVKKLMFTRRNLFTLVAEFFLPAALLACNVLIGRQNSNKSIASPALELKIDDYEQLRTTIFHSGSERTNQLAELYRKSFEESASPSRRILNEKIFDSNTIEKNSLDYLVDFGSKREDLYNLYYLFAIILNESSKKTIEIIAMFNNQAYHTSAQSIRLIDELILRWIMKNEQFKLKVWNEPFQRRATSDVTINALGFDFTIQISISHCVQFSLSFMLASFIIFLVKERDLHFKHIQKISGLSSFKYWLSNFIIDYIFYLISSVLMCTVLYVLNVEVYSSMKEQFYLFTIFAANGFASLPLVYLFSLCFSSSETAYVRLSLYILMLGTITFFLVIILQIPSLKLLKLSKTLETIFIFIFPIFNTSNSIYIVASNYLALDLCLSKFSYKGFVVDIQKVCKSDHASILGLLMVCCKDKCGDKCLSFEENQWVWSKPGIGRNIVAFFLQFIAGCLFLAFFESNLVKKFRWRKQTPHYDKSNFEEDVVEERLRIQQTSLPTLCKTDSMIVKNIRKNYGNFEAVRDISFGVKHGECFGVLGENGAGKTTLFKMITGYETITSGEVFINGIDIRENMTEIYKYIGYCPQFDGLLEHLTGRETLRIISRIRGIKENFIDSQIEVLSELLRFRKHIDHQVQSYSGGTKRKLSFAIAIVGNPLITFLDEPTTGVDPVSRRCLWNAINLVRSSGSSLVLTSHSMEECEALCNRLTIMVHGKMTCLGSPLHLKEKYGAGYIVQIRLKLSDSNESLIELVKILNSFMQNNFQNCFCDAKHNNSVVYRIESNENKLSALFGRIEQYKSSLMIEDYSIYQTSLERIFLSFVRKR
ncbi:ABC transporter sub-family A-like protein 9 [Sarcoptes scabiei]|uniref:ABC transporter sub-family A-like protein 9 n=1 Tax=Sarcoptes scabiei TaxID=52283 RepID=A0A132A7P5_SARSC|nr:ABC transporter sub-family A-like protein 9 [Sarcoptes scabiei]